MHSLFARSIVRSTAAGLTGIRCQPYHAATGIFSQLDKSGKPISKEIKIHIGNPHEAYVQIPREIGQALRGAPSDAAEASTSTIPQPEVHPMTFFHSLRTFGQGPSAPGYPCLEVPQDLPRQMDGDTSPATLHLVGEGNEIVLDGTYDAWFTNASCATYKNLKPALDILKSR